MIIGHGIVSMASHVGACFLSKHHKRSKTSKLSSVLCRLPIDDLFQAHFGISDWQKIKQSTDRRQSHRIASPFHFSSNSFLIPDKVPSQLSPQHFCVSKFYFADLDSKFSISRTVYTYTNLSSWTSVVIFNYVKA